MMYNLVVLIKNPVCGLIETVKILRDSNGIIHIKHWYQEVILFSKKDLKLISKESFNETVFKKEFGTKSFAGNKKGLDTKKH